ncbi:hypothetical protein D0B32_21245 [Paraburkholderia sp. DHOC27]|nr:hypothetical protein D0B32_21245 [Paraburkholderia sp. DHOC27]
MRRGNLVERDGHNGLQLYRTLLGRLYRYCAGGGRYIQTQMNFEMPSARWIRSRWPSGFTTGFATGFAIGFIAGFAREVCHLG